MEKELSLGKIRGLQELANPNGVFTITALDHRGSLRRAIHPDKPETVEFLEMVELKIMLLHHLSPHSSAVLIDPIYGAAPAITRGLISGKQGFLVSLESTGYEQEDGDRITHIAEGWSVEKIKRMGASAVKLLLYYNPESRTAVDQETLVRNVADQCKEFDIPLLVEPMTYSIPDGPEKGTKAFAKLKPDMVIKTAQRLCPLGIDVLKAEFPDDTAHEEDERMMADHCRNLTQAAGIPWVLLSAGASYERFKMQLEIACKNGASGFLAGRAVWQEAPGLPIDERREFLETTALERLNDLTEIANQNARSWLKIYEEQLAAVDVREGWQARY